MKKNTNFATKLVGMSQKTKENTDTLVDIIVYGMQEKKAENIVCMDLRKLKSSFADMMVICHGNNDRQIEAIADSVEETVKNALGEKPLHREGSDRAEWVLLDYVNIVVHIFSTDKRAFYNLEELWGDAEIKHIA